MAKKTENAPVDETLCPTCGYKRGIVTVEGKTGKRMARVMCLCDMLTNVQIAVPQLLDVTLDDVQKPYSGPSGNAVWIGHDRLVLVQLARLAMTMEKTPMLLSEREVLDSKMDDESRNSWDMVAYQKFLVVGLSDSNNRAACDLMCDLARARTGLKLVTWFLTPGLINKYERLWQLVRVLKWLIIK